MSRSWNVGREEAPEDFDELLREDSDSDGDEEFDIGDFIELQDNEPEEQEAVNTPEPEYLEDVHLEPDSELPDPSEQLARAMGERGSTRGPRSHHNWGARVGRPGEAHRSEPKGLLELEALAKRTVERMERHLPKSEHNYDRAMDLLRLQYNLNFIVVCEKCGGPHVYDEIIAPER